MDEAILGLDALTPADLISAVGVKAVAERVGVSVAAVYHHFGSIDGLAAAVLERVFSVEDFPTHVINAHTEQVAAAAFPADVALTMHRAEYARLTSDPLLRARLGLWALGGGQVDEAYGAFLRGVDRTLAIAAQALYDTWGREMRPPFDMDAYVAAHVAFLSGTSVRALVDPDALDVERYAHLASAFGLMASRLVGDRRSLGDRLTELNLLPLERAKAAHRGAAQASTRERIIGAAAQLFGSHGYAGMTLPEVARLAGLGRSTLYEQFDDIEDLAAHVMRGAVEQRLSGASLRGVGRARLHDALLQLAESVLGRPDLASPYGAKLLAGTLPLPDPLLAWTERSCALAREDGLLRADAPIDEMAQQLVLMVVARVAARPASTPEQVAQAAENAALGGYLASLAD